MYSSIPLGENSLVFKNPIMCCLTDVTQKGKFRCAAKVTGYKEADEANSKELGEEEDAVDCYLQQADRFE